MTTLELSEARASHDGRQIGPLTARYDGSVVLLWGNFTWLFALLSGRIALDGGAVRCLGVDARSAVVAGSASVSPAPVQRAPAWTVTEWLTLNLELLGSSPRRARASAAQTLRDLVLTGLSNRKVSELNAAESFAAHSAFAICNEPAVAFLSAPMLLPETRDFELAIIERLMSRAKLVIACTRQDATLWNWADTHAYCDGSVGGTLPVELMVPAGTSYRVRTFGASDVLMRTLASFGVGVRADGEGWVVTTPSGSGSELIVAAAVEAGVSLRELVSVPDAR